jgi:hypothetical protein
MIDGSYTPEEGQAIAIFIEALPCLCEEMLAAGKRVGDEWVVGDLEGNPGTSCHVNTAKGVFYDHNPAANRQRGGAIVLFGEFFGYRGCEEGEVLAAMVEWARGKDAPAPKPEKKDSLLTQEEKLIAAIAIHEADIAEAEAGRIDPRWIQWSTPEEWIAELRGRLGRAREWLAQVQKQIKAQEAEARKREKAETAKWTELWAELSAASISCKEELARYLAEYRGLSVDVFRWLIERGYVAFDADLQIAFPIVKRKAVVGMHIKWLREDGSSGWYCAPPGIKPGPLIIGNLEGADLVVIAESTWDTIRYIDLYELYKEGGWAAVVTRGAGNASKIPKEKIDRAATIFLLLQNDEANAEWCRRLPFLIRKWGYPIAPPDGIKDLNDWMRAVPRPEILQRLRNNDNTNE